MDAVGTGIKIGAVACAFIVLFVGMGWISMPEFNQASVTGGTSAWPQPVCEYAYKDIPERRWTVETVVVKEMIRCEKCHNK